MTAKRKTKKRARKRRFKRCSISDIISTNLKSRTADIASSVTSNNALLKKLRALTPKPKPLTKAQIAKQKRDRKRGERYLAMAHKLGVYEDQDDD